MSAIVCQNLVSCFEPQLAETATVLKLKVAAAAPAAMDYSKKAPSSEVKTTFEFGNWGFLQTIPKEEKESSYTHPSAKYSSFSRLSQKSLELCTEYLGSETGTDIITDSSTAAILNSTTGPPENPARPTKNPRREVVDGGRKIRNFPPPLTTMSGSNSLQVRRHREGGRLVIEAVETPFRNTYLQAERSDGRLKLCFLTGSDSAAATTGGEDVGENEDEYGGAAAVEAEEEIDEPRIENEFLSEYGEFDGEINLEKFQRLNSRCKDGGSHGSPGFSRSTWKPALWVATS